MKLLVPAPSASRPTRHSACAKSLPRHVKIVTEEVAVKSQAAKRQQHLLSPLLSQSKACSRSCPNSGCPGRDGRCHCRGCGRRRAPAGVPFRPRCTGGIQRGFATPPGQTRRPGGYRHPSGTQPWARPLPRTCGLSSRSKGSAT